MRGSVNRNISKKYDYIVISIPKNTFYYGFGTFHDKTVDTEENIV